MTEKALRFLFGSGILSHEKGGGVHYNKGRGAALRKLAGKGAPSATYQRKVGRAANVSHNHNTNAVKAGAFSGRAVIGGKAAHLQSGKGGKVDHSGTRAARIAAGRERAIAMLSNSPSRADPYLAKTQPSYKGSRERLGRVQASLRVRVKEAHINQAADQIVNLPKGQRAAVVRGLFAEGKSAYTAQVRGAAILKQAAASTRQVYKIPGLSQSEQRRLYAQRKQREERIGRLLGKYRAKS